MIELKVNGKSLDLGEKPSLSFKIQNPVFETDTLPGTYSLPFALPLSPVNRNALGFPELLESVSPTKEFDCELVCDTLLFVGTLIIKSTKGNLANVTIQLGLSALANKLKETKLTEVPMDVLMVPNTRNYYGFRLTIDSDHLINRYYSVELTWLNKVSNDYYSFYYGGRFPNGEAAAFECLAEIVSSINTSRPVEEFNGGVIYPLNSLVYWTDKVWRSYEPDANEHAPGAESGWWDLVCEVDEWNILRRNWCLSHDFTMNVPWWKYDSFDDDKRAKAYQDYAGEVPVVVIYDPLNGVGAALAQEQSNWVVAAPATWSAEPEPDVPSYISELSTTNVQVMQEFMEARVAESFLLGSVKYFPIHNTKFSPETSYTGVVNWYFEEAFGVNTPYGTDVFATSAQVRLRYVMGKVFEFLERQLKSPILDSSFFKTLVIISNFSNDRIVRRNHLETWWTGYYDAFARSINPADSMPDVSLGEFINGVRSFFFLGCWFDLFSKNAVWRPLKELLADRESAVDLSPWLQDDLEKTFDEVKGYALKYTHDSGDSAIGDAVKGDIYFEGRTILDPVESLDDLPNVITDGVVCLVLERNQWFERVREISEVLTWRYYSENLYSLKIGDGKTVYQPKAGIPLMRSDYDPVGGPKEMPPYFQAGGSYGLGEWVRSYSVGVEYPGDPVPFFKSLIPDNDQLLSNTSAWLMVEPRRWKVPMVAQERNSRNYPERTKCSLRFVSYAGLRPNPLNPAEEYPLATTNLYEDVGVLWPDEPGGSLRWEGQYGIYQQFGKEWITFLQKRKKVVITLVMTELLFNRLKLWNLVFAQEHYCVIESIDLQLPLPAKAKITMWTV